ncbi:MAG: hypothetical protein EXQ93_00610 [Alphaproteobacteria bacterium]|nr:hypothetical protein [Alphaproteobacteria bacterium]
MRVDIEGATVGYLNREHAKQYRQQLLQAGQAGITATCPALIVGGWDRGRGNTGHFGVKLDIPMND